MSVATKCTCGHSINGFCASSVAACRNLIKAMSNNQQLPVEAENELITEDRLKELGFEHMDYGDETPYDTYRKDGIEVSEYNGECWLIEMLDQNNIERPIKYLSELEAFFNGCGQSIYGATEYATKMHQARELLSAVHRSPDNGDTDDVLNRKIQKFLYGE